MGNLAIRLCAKCDENLYVDTLGECMWCLKPTASESFQICYECAYADGICQMCLGEC